LTAWFGLMAPAGTPAAVVDWLNGQANKVLSAPDVRNRFAANGGVLPLGTPQAFGAHIASETKKFGEVIRKANIKIE
jgi:tripartite-type tricarboxylate transporter receptor subunit TctC